MNKYLVVYYKDDGIRNIWIVPEAKNSNHAKRIASASRPIREGVKVTALKIESFKHLWSWK